MYYLSKKEYQKDKLKVLILGLVIGISLGLCAGFLWGVATIEDMIRTGALQVPRQMRVIPF